MRVLMIVQQVDESNWLRGFIVGWIRALARRVEHLHVLALEVTQAPQLPDNVTLYTMGKERGYSRARELTNFYRIVASLAPSVDVIFSHMTPRYTWLAAPIAIPLGKPQMLWFTHPKPSAETRVALITARWITTATPESFPYISPKVHVMGHGIDTAFYAPAPTLTSPIERPLIVSVGRVTPIKHHHTLLEAAALLKKRGLKLQFIVVGGMAAQGDKAYHAELLARRDALGLSPIDFAMSGAMSAESTLDLTRGASAVVNLTPPGSFDKAALEGMLIEKPLVYCNPAFDALTGHYADLLRAGDSGDALAVADRLQAVLALSESERAEIGKSLRQQTAAAHGLESLMARLVKLMAEG